MADLDARAAAFAEDHGSFSLLFDAGENYGGREPCPLPWSVMLDGDESRGWGGHTAAEALDFAASDLAGMAARSRVAEAERPEQIVLHFSWEQDGIHRQETYGPWTVTEDMAHLAEIAGFIKDWRRLTGIRPHVITMAMAVDPAAWVREHENSGPVAPEPAAEGVTLEPGGHAYPAGGILSVGTEPVTP